MNEHELRAQMRNCQYSEGTRQGRAGQHSTGQGRMRLENVWFSRGGPSTGMLHKEREQEQEQQI